MRGSDQFVEFCRRFLVTPKGAGAKKPIRVRDWQKDLVGTLLDDDRPLVVWCLPRGQGKSTITAALALHHVFMSGIEGARAVIVAQDERSATRMLTTAARMVALNEELDSRAWVYKDRITIPGTDSHIVALPGEAARIEGEDASLAIVDEVGIVRRDAFESALHSTGKRAGSKLLAIGTPSPPSWREMSPLLDLVLDGRANPDGADLRVVEYSAPIGCAVDDEEAWAAANPGLDDLVQRSALRAALPPRSRESEFRRARLGQWVEQDDAAFLPPGTWPKLSTGRGVPDGERVVLALDGSFNGDATALVVATVDKQPHMDVAGLWEPPDGDESWRVPILEVEQTIRQACRRWNVLELTADPFRWARTLQLLDSEGIPVTEFNQTSARLTPATTDAYQAAINGEISHSGNTDLARHVGNATVTEDARGVRLAKEKRGSHRRIDLAVCVVMAHSRATWRASTKRRKKAKGFRS
ncbi:terminase TerL endonuclease subunit [Dietzia sp. NPDC055343]